MEPRPQRRRATATCGCRCSRPCARTQSRRCSRAGTLDDLRRRHAERFLELAAEAEDELAGPDRPTGSSASSASSTTSAPRSTGASRPGGSRTPCGRSRRSTASGARTATSARRGAGSRSVSRSPATCPTDVRADALCGPRRDQAAAQSDLGRGCPRSWRRRSRSSSRARPRPRRGRTALSFLSFVAPAPRTELEQCARAARRALALAQRGRRPAQRPPTRSRPRRRDAAPRAPTRQAIAQYEEAVELRTQARRSDCSVVDAVYNLGMAAFQGGSVDRARSSLRGSARARAQPRRQFPTSPQRSSCSPSLDLASGDNSTAVGRARESYSLYATLGDDRSSRATWSSSRGRRRRTARSRRPLDSREPPTHCEERATGRVRAARARRLPCASRIDARAPRRRLASRASADVCAATSSSRRGLTRSRGVTSLPTTSSWGDREGQDDGKGKRTSARHSRGGLCTTTSSEPRGSTKLSMRFRGLPS